MQLKSKPLLAALQKVIGLASKRTSLPVLNSVKLEAKGNILEISASDLDCFAVAKCECDGDLIPLCVPAFMFLGLVKSAGESVTLETKEKRLLIEGNGKASVSFLDGEEFPPFPSDKLKGVGVSATDLADCIEGAAWAANPNSQANYLHTAVWVKMEPKQLRCAATDGKKFSQVIRPLICADTEFMLPAKHSAMVCDALRRDGSTLELSEKWMVCKSESLSLAVRLVEGGYFRMDWMLSQERHLVGKIEIAPLLEALTTAEMLSAPAQFCPIRLTPGKGGIVVEFHGENSEFSVAVGNECSGRPFRMQAELGREVLRNTAGETVTASIGCQSLFLESGEQLTAIALLADKAP